MMSLPRPFLRFLPGAVCRLEIPRVQMTTLCLAPESVHLRADELPPGRLVVSVSKHLTAVIVGVIP